MTEGATGTGVGAGSFLATFFAGVFLGGAATAGALLGVNETVTAIAGAGPGAAVKFGFSLDKSDCAIVFFMSAGKAAT